MVALEVTTLVITTEQRRMRMRGHKLLTSQNGRVPIVAFITHPVWFDA